ncbi:unnamed protein product [Caenorhabditis nigoni]
MSEEGVPAKRRREDGPDEQPDLRKLIETNISELKTMVNNQTKNILVRIEKLENQVEKTILEKIEKINPKKILEKTFVLRETFQDVLTIKEGEERPGTEYEHFGRKWRIVIKRVNDLMYASLMLMKQLGEEETIILLTQKISISFENHDRISKTVKNRFRGGSEYLHRLLSWKEMEQRYVKDGSVNLEVQVKLHKLECPIELQIHKFGVTNEKFSNVILNVDGRRFYVLKELLSMHSPYFEKLFTGGFQESGKPEVTLKEVDPQDFQNFLEALHGYPVVDDCTVEGILLLNDVYDAKMISHRCKVFLMESSKKTVVKKLQLSSRYQIDGLANKTILDIKDAAEFRKLVTEGKNDFSPEILKALLDKGLSFHSS